MSDAGIDKPWTHHRARVARAMQSGDLATEADARLALRAARLAEHIKTAVAAAPPLTDEQRQRLAALLAPAVQSVTAQQVPRNRRGGRGGTP